MSSGPNCRLDRTLRLYPGVLNFAGVGADAYLLRRMIEAAMMAWPDLAADVAYRCLHTEERTA